MTRPTANSTQKTIAKECLAVRLRILNRYVTKVYDDSLRSLGVKTSQLNVLVATGMMGLARPADVCQRLQMDASTLSRNVDRMKAKGWLEVVEEEDGRAQPFRLTAKGRRLLERAKPAWDEAQAEVRDLLGAETFDAIEHAVHQIHARGKV